MYSNPQNLKHLAKFMPITGI